MSAAAMSPAAVRNAAVYSHSAERMRREIALKTRMSVKRRHHVRRREQRRDPLGVFVRCRMESEHRMRSV